MLGSVRVSVATPPTSERSTVGKMALPAGSGPISLRDALIAGEVILSSKFCAAASPVPTGPTNCGSPKTEPNVAREVAIIGGDDEVGDIVEEQVVLELA